MQRTRGSTAGLSSSTPFNCSRIPTCARRGRCSQRAPLADDACTRIIIQRPAGGPRSNAAVKCKIGNVSKFLDFLWIHFFNFCKQFLFKLKFVYCFSAFASDIHHCLRLIWVSSTFPPIYIYIYIYIARANVRWRCCGGVGCAAR